MIKDDVSSVTAVKMSPVVLPCHATGRPEPVISWNKNWMQLGARGGSYRVLPTGQMRDNNNKQFLTTQPTVTDIVYCMMSQFLCHRYTGALEILAATPSHAGKYTCSARNPVGVAYKHVTLTVQGKT